MALSALRLGLIGGLILPLGLASAGFAQPSPPPDHGMGMAMRQGDWGSPAEHAARLAARLSAMLQLRPDQAPALQIFLRAVTPPPGAMQRMAEQRQVGAGLTTPQRLDRMMARLDRMRSMLAERATATKAFYAQLTPPQQRAFDALGPVIARSLMFGAGTMDHPHGGGRGMGGPHGWAGAGRP